MRCGTDKVTQCVQRYRGNALAWFWQPVPVVDDRADPSVSSPSDVAAADMRTSTPPNNEPANIARICAPTIPVVDWRPIRGSLAAFRSGYEEIEQFVSQLLDEIDAAWQELDAERVRGRIDSRVRGDRSSRSAGTALLPALVGARFHPRPTKRSNGALPNWKRIDIRCRLKSSSRGINLPSRRSRWTTSGAGQPKNGRRGPTNSDSCARRFISRWRPSTQCHERRRQRAASSADSATSADATNHGPNDPVLGPLLTQFKILQRDAARRRETSG